MLIPCYDLGRYLDEAVESVLAQTFQDFEIVIVNDGSTDPATNALLAAYDRPKARVIAAPHRGLAATRNLAIRESRGAYLCALDADDRLAPRYLEKTVRALDEDPSLAFVSSWLEMFGDERGLWRRDACDLVTLLAEDTVHTAALVRRAAVLAVGGYDEAMPAQGYEDWDLWLSLVERGHRGTILPEALFHYRRRAGSMSAACCHGATHLALVDYLVRKHAASYAAHLRPVLLRKDAEIGDALRANDELERHLATSLEPEVARRREERDALRKTLEAAEGRGRGETGPGRAAGRVAEAGRRAAEGQARADHLEAALHRAEAEIAALRHSLSWRVTGPLRAVYGWLRRRRGSA